MKITLPYCIMFSSYATMQKVKSSEYVMVTYQFLLYLLSCIMHALNNVQIIYDIQFKWLVMISFYYSRLFLIIQFFFSKYWNESENLYFSWCPNPPTYIWWCVLCCASITNFSPSLTVTSWLCLSVIQY